MHPAFIITDINGSREFSDDQLPLSIGTARDADIRLPEWEGNGPFAQISMLDDRCFIQPQNPNVKLKLNGVSLVAPRWIDDGDILSIGESEIELRDDGDEFEFAVFLSSEETETASPEIAEAEQAKAADQEPQTTGEVAASDATSVSDHVKSDGSAEAVVQALRANHADTDNASLPKAADTVSESIAREAPENKFPDIEPPDMSADGAGELPEDEQIAPSERIGPMAPLPPLSAPVRPEKSQPEPPAKKNKSGFLRLCWLLLAALIAYVALSSKVTVATLPAGAQVAMQPKWMAPGRSGRFFLVPGGYQFEVTAPGYKPETGRVDVGFMQRTNLSIELEELPGRLDFSLPDDLAGTLWIDGEQVAELSDLPIALPKGAHDYRIETELYQPFSGSVEIIGRDELQTVSPDLNPEWGSFAVASNPPGAEIYLGNRLLGTTPATVDVTAGKHELELRLQGFRSERKAVSAVAGDVELLPVVDLQQLGSSIQIVTTPEGASVNSAGKFLGVTPVVVEAPTDTVMNLRISKPGYAPVRRNIRAEQDEQVELQVSLQQLAGTVVIEAKPIDALLFIDGELSGTANQELVLGAFEHKIEVRKEGYQTWSTLLTPTPDVPQRVDVSLLTDTEARLASLPARLTSSLDTQLVLVKPGQLTLGSRSSDQGRRANEVVRNVSLERPFYIGTTEVTNVQFAQFNARHLSAPEPFSPLNDPNKPVVMVSWNEAAAYCNWLSDREGLGRAYVMQRGVLQLASPATDGYRLPTEAEWAWVARYAGQSNPRRFPWGMTMPPPENAGNYADASTLESLPNALLNYVDGNAFTANVGSFPANPLGVFDLGGNAAEWTNDYYRSSATSALLIDPTGPASGQSRVIRGSSWRQSAVSDLRLAARDFGSEARNDVGFRLARYAADPADTQAIALELVNE